MKKKKIHNFPMAATKLLTTAKTSWLEITSYNQLVGTSGTCGSATLKFLEELGSKLTNIACDPSETSWIHQRTSLAVVRGNTASTVSCPKL